MSQLLYRPTMHDRIQLPSMAENKMTLYIAAASPPSRCVAYFLKYHKIDSVEIKLVDLFADEHKEPWFLEMNPQGTVPVLHDQTNDLCLWESTAILEYLADKFKITGIYGLEKDGPQRYKTINALHNVHNFTVKANMDIMSIWYASAFGDKPLDLEVLKSAIKTTKAGKFTLLEQILTKNGGFIAGDKATIADFRVWTDLFQLSNKGGDVTLSLVDFSEFPTMTAYIQYGIDNIFTPYKEFWNMVLGYHEWAEEKLGGKDYRVAQ